MMLNGAVVLPALVMAIKLNPLSAKKAALLGGMVRLDVGMVADVFAFTDEVRDLRNRIQKDLIEEALGNLDGDSKPEEELPADQQAAIAAKQLFDR